MNVQLNLFIENLCETRWKTYVNFFMNLMHVFCYKFCINFNIRYFSSGFYSIYVVFDVYFVDYQFVAPKVKSYTDVK